MGRFLVRRVTGVVVLLFVISFVTFGLFNLVPSNPASLYCGKGCTPAKIAGSASARPRVKKPSGWTSCKVVGLVLMPVPR